MWVFMYRNVRTNASVRPVVPTVCNTTRTTFIWQLPTITRKIYLDMLVCCTAASCLQRKPCHHSQVQGCCRFGSESPAHKLWSTRRNRTIRRQLPCVHMIEWVNMVGRDFFSDWVKFLHIFVRSMYFWTWFCFICVWIFAVDLIVFLSCVTADGTSEDNECMCGIVGYQSIKTL